MDPYQIDSDWMSNQKKTCQITPNETGTFRRNGSQILVASTKRLWKKQYFQTVVAVVLIVAAVFGFWYGSQAALNTEIPPALAVVSGSMDTISDGRSQGWAHPFARTLQIGDLIVIQGVDAKDLKTNYPDSDIIVFQRPDNPSELIVHRIVATRTIDGKLYFFTKGDGNSPPDTWPTVPQSYEYDHWYNSDASIPQGAVSQDLVVGKVIMRVPLIGYIPMFIQRVIGDNSRLTVMPIIVMLITLIVIIEFVVPLLRRKQLPKQTSLKQQT